MLDGQTWYRYRKTPHTIMTTMGPVKYWRARYRTGKNGPSPRPVDLGLDLPRDPVAGGDRLLPCVRASETAADQLVAPGWYDRYRRILRDDTKGMDKTIRSLRYYRDAAKYGRDVIEPELGYFRKNRRRMRYHELKEKGVPIGSGVVGAAFQAMMYAPPPANDAAPADARTALAA